MAGALEAGFLSAALGGILVILLRRWGGSGQLEVLMQMDGESKDVCCRKKMGLSVEMLMGWERWEGGEWKLGEKVVD